jgi:hypothetical protein
MFDLEICTLPQGWIGAACKPEHIEIAKERYVERQQRCRAGGMQGNFAPDDMPDAVRDTKDDHRWSGDLGEMLVKDYLELRAIDHDWLAGARESEYDPDFRINRVHIDVKTKRRKHIPLKQDDYFETINNDQFLLAPKRKIIGFLFCDYAYEDRWIYLIGKISYAQFDQHKIWREKGTMSNVCKISADSWDVPITKINTPLNWVKAA